MKKGKDIKPHIGIFGRRNNGKSSFINAITDQDVAIVSEVAGTTTDPVKKSVEIFGIGPVIIVDTAGIDDVGSLGDKRKEKSLKMINDIDLAILIIAQNQFDETEMSLIQQFKNLSLPYVIIHNKSDIEKLNKETKAKIKILTKKETIDYSNINKTYLSSIVEELKKEMPETAYNKPSLFEGMIKPKDIVLLVTPIDSEAPEARMILPQVMAWRDLLDNDAICVSVKETELEEVLKTEIKPSLVVTDSQVFDYVASILPQEVPLTSFSIVFARLKGDMKAYIQGAKQIDKLKDNDKVLILESCTHQLSCEDIGRFKIPKWLRSYTKQNLEFKTISGQEGLPANINEYALAVQCGGCVATRRQILNKIKHLSDSKVPVTNYGLLIAYIHGIFDRVIQPIPKT